MFLLQHATEEKPAVQKQKKRKVSSKTGGGKRTRSLGLYSFSFQCPNCLTLHRGTATSDTEQLQIECLELLDNVAVTDDRFLLWLASKQRGMEVVCGYVHYQTGKKMNSIEKSFTDEGLHQLYQGEADQEIIQFLEERHKRYEEKEKEIES